MSLTTRQRGTPRQQAALIRLHRDGPLDHHPRGFGRRGDGRDKLIDLRTARILAERGLVTIGPHPGGLRMRLTELGRARAEQIEAPDA